MSSVKMVGGLCLPEMVAAALAFLDGRSLTVFEAASKGSRQTVQDNPDLYKTLLVRSPLKLVLCGRFGFVICSVFLRRESSTQTAVDLRAAGSCRCVRHTSGAKGEKGG